MRKINTFIGSVSNVSKLFFIYTLGNIFILLNFQGVYWDSWIIYNTDDYEDLKEIFSMVGSPISADIHYLLSHVGNGVYSYRLLTFFSFFLSGLFVYKILNEFILKSTETSFWVALVYLLLPVNSVKFLAINSISIYCLFLFSFASYLFLYYLSGRNSYLKFFALLLFFMSFLMNSLLVYYLIILLYLFYHDLFLVKKYINFNINNYLFFLLKRLDFILLPVVFWVVKQYFYLPYGGYEGYNSLSFEPYVFLELLFASYKNTILGFLIGLFPFTISSWIVFFLLIFLFFILLCVTYSNEVNKITFTKVVVFCFLGVFLCVLAITPYAAVGKPLELGWRERHQILMPFGLALSIYALFCFLTICRVNKKLVKFFLVLFLSICCVKNNYNGWLWIKDWYYQVSLIENFKDSSIMKENSTFVTGKFYLGRQLIFGRYLGVYEVNGLMKKAFRNDSRLAVYEESDIESYSKSYGRFGAYGFSNWEYEKPLEISISKSKMSYSTIDYLYLLWLQFVDEREFRHQVKNLTEISAK